MTHILGRLVSFDIPGFISFLKFQCTLSQPLKRKMHNFSDVGDIEIIVSNNCHNLFKNYVTQKSKLEKRQLLPSSFNCTKYIAPIVFLLYNKWLLEG